MNRNALKSYAPKARRDFIAAVTARAAKLGVTAKGTAPVSVEGDFAIIGGTAFPKKVAAQRELLGRRIRDHGFSQVMESTAYTWFNRLAAIRYMELHGYFDHGYRVLSQPKGEPMPEILQHADQVELPGLQRAAVLALKLDGRKDEELFRMLLSAQCNALHAAMPFLFERIDDETELLLPDNLLHTDSVVRQLVNDIDENDWKEIEIIGWLYQYYISERKDEVIGKIVSAEDIPAATQLFTPNWIVKYMVQNSLGAKWLASYPDSPLRAKMQYYIEPAMQLDEVRLRLAEEAPANIDPETLTLIDPACGSGHIIVEGYDLLKEIYLERGYTLRQIPRLIVENNLFGIDIDDRAAQLAGFALLMKAGADDRTVFVTPPRLNILSLTDSEGWDANQLADALAPSRAYDLVPADDLMPETLAQPVLTGARPAADVKSAVSELVETFVGAKAYGSLIMPSANLQGNLPYIESVLSTLTPGDLLQQQVRNEAHSRIGTLVRQTHILSRQYVCVVANPPYMGQGYFPPELKSFIDKTLNSGSSNLYAAFMLRNIHFLAANGFSAMINIPQWMFASSFTKLREELFEISMVHSLCHNGRGVFGSDFGSVAFVQRKIALSDYRATYCRLFDVKGDVATNEVIRERFFDVQRRTYRSLDELDVLPNLSMGYWASDAQLDAFRSMSSLSKFADLKSGLSTGDNPQFQRQWHEVSQSRLALPHEFDGKIAPDKKWVPCNSGGDFRKWYGNNSIVVNWANDGIDIRNVRNKKGKIASAVRNEEFYFREGFTWNKITAAKTSVRYFPAGYLFDDTGRSGFTDGRSLPVIGFLCSRVAEQFLQLLAPSMSFTSGEMNALPFTEMPRRIDEIVSACISLARDDWNSFETSWDFTRSPFLQAENAALTSVALLFSGLCRRWTEMTTSLQQLEQESNSVFLETYGLADEMPAEVDLDDITLRCNPHHRYGSGMSAEARSTRLQSDTIRELLSYIVGCVMGRYSLVRDGVVYAGQRNEEFNSALYGHFAASADGILPVTQDDWFADDACNRAGEFFREVWGSESVAGNLKFVADSLGTKPNETPLDTIRRYFSRDFFKDHLQVFKARPIYWLFSSGKEKAFECLVYLHRYNPGTLSRMRMEYVVPLQSKLRGKIDQSEASIQSASGSAAQTKLRKEVEKLKRQQAELVRFDEELRHFADQRIEFDLDDGVRVNYAKFGNLLAEVKKVSGDDDE
jgi:type II restriction/modification system DNA methylase subunit YeeA